MSKSCLFRTGFQATRASFDKSDSMRRNTDYGSMQNFIHRSKHHMSSCCLWIAWGFNAPKRPAFCSALVVLVAASWLSAFGQVMSVNVVAGSQ